MPANSRQDIFDLTFDEFKAWLVRMHEPQYRAGQVWSALWNSKVRNFNEIGTLPVPLRTKLAVVFLPPVDPVPDQTKLSPDGTCKALFTFLDGTQVEAVAIPKEDRLTFCLSTQVGCAMGCKFCATALLGFRRHCTSGEILAQVRGLTALLGRKPTNLVFMGMGEPLQNLEAVRRSLGTLAHPQVWNWPASRSLVSTSGWLPGILSWTRDPLPAKLAISLNAVGDDLRSELMPINRQFPLARVLSALRAYVRKTGDPVSVEYVLLAGINDRPQDAAALVQILKHLPAKVNLIPYNPIPGLPYRPAPETAVAGFSRTLKHAHIPVTLRTPRGSSIAAACGQLAGATRRRAA